MSVSLTCYGWLFDRFLECHIHTKSNKQHSVFMCVWERIPGVGLSSCHSCERQEQTGVTGGDAKQLHLWSSKDILFLASVAESNHSLFWKQLKCNNYSNANVWARSIQLEKKTMCINISKQDSKTSLWTVHCAFHQAIQKLLSQLCSVWMAALWFVIVVPSV